MLKDAPPDEVIKALHQVRSGNRYLSDDLAMQVALSAIRSQNPFRCVSGPSHKCFRCW